MHVAVADSRDLQRIIVEQLATRPEVGHCQTHLVFDRPITAPVRPLTVHHGSPVQRDNAGPTG